MITKQDLVNSPIDRQLPLRK